MTDPSFRFHCYSQATIAQCSCIDICPPADHYLPGVEDDANEYASCATNTAHIDMANQSEETGLRHTVSLLDRLPRGQEQVYAFPSGIRRPKMADRIP
jgi:hypothetical protein